MQMTHFFLQGRHIFKHLPYIDLFKKVVFMRRKDFFKKLLMGGTGMILAQVPVKSVEPVTMQKIGLATIFIAGFPHYDGPEAESLLEAGMPLQLNRQPHNKYDKYAIELLSGEAKLGYVPRADNKTIAKLMDKGIVVQAEIKELYPGDHFVDKVKVEIWYERPVES